jgi:hypothetical protein
MDLIVKISDKIERFIWSKKWLPPIVYFGTLGSAFAIMMGYNPYIDSTLFYFWFLYITWLCVKNIKKKND